MAAMLPARRFHRTCLQPAEYSGAYWARPVSTPNALRDGFIEQCREQLMEERTLDAVLAALSYRLRSESGLPAGARHDPEPAVTQLRDASALLQTVLDQLPEGVTIAYGPPDFPIITSSRRLEELMGFARHDLLGMVAGLDAGNRGLFLRDGVTRPRVEHVPLYRASRFGETIRNEELVLARPDGTRINVLVDANPIKTAGGRIVGAIACWRDVTDMKQAQHALQLVEAQLRDADRRKDEFLGMLAHELRGPLSAICNVVHVLKLMASGQPKLHEIGDILDRQVKAITRLLDDLLDLSRVTRGKLSLNMEPVEILPVINQAVEWNRAVIVSKEQQLVVAHPPEPILVNGDTVRLAQVVSNLLGNAAKFTDAGGRIWITAETADEEAIVRVRDNGPGVKASDLKNIFDLFYQLERTVDRTGRGLGIGLSLVRRLIEMHGGSVEVVSEGPGRGSEFLLRLPLISTANSPCDRRLSEIDKAREIVLDHALQATFPASDPLSVTQPGGGQQRFRATVARDAPSE